MFCLPINKIIAIINQKIYNILLNARIVLLKARNDTHKSLKNNIL